MRQKNERLSSLTFSKMGKLIPLFPSSIHAAVSKPIGSVRRMRGPFLCLGIWGGSICVFPRRFHKKVSCQFQFQVRRMGKLFKTYLSGTAIYKCVQCNSHLTNHEELVSKVGTPKSYRLFVLTSNVLVLSRNARQSVPF